MYLLVIIMDIFIEDIFERTRQEQQNLFYPLVFKYPSHDIFGYLLSRVISVNVL